MASVGEWWPVKLKLLEANYEKTKLRIRESSLYCKLSILQVQNLIEQENVITQKYENKAVTQRLFAIEKGLEKEAQEKEQKTIELVEKIESLKSEKENEKRSNQVMVGKMLEELIIMKRKESEWKDENSKLLVRISKLEGNLAAKTTDAVQQANAIVSKENSTVISKNQDSVSKSHNDDSSRKDRGKKSAKESGLVGSRQADTDCRQTSNDVFLDSNNQKSNVQGKDENVVDADNSAIETSFLERTDKMLRNCRMQSMRKRRAFSDIGSGCSLEAAPGNGEQDGPVSRARSRSQYIVKEYNLRSILRSGRRERRVTFSDDLEVRMFRKEQEELLKRSRELKKTVAAGNDAEPQRISDKEEVRNIVGNSINHDVSSTGTAVGNAVETKQDDILVSLCETPQGDVAASNKTMNVASPAIGRRKTARRRTKKMVKDRRLDCQERGATKDTPNKIVGIPDRKGDKSSEVLDKATTPELTMGNGFHETNSRPSGLRRSARKKPWKFNYIEDSDVKKVPCKESTEIESTTINNNIVSSGINANNGKRLNMKHKNDGTDAQSLEQTPLAEKSTCNRKGRPMSGLRKNVSGAKPRKRLVKTFPNESVLRKESSKGSENQAVVDIGVQTVAEESGGKMTSGNLKIGRKGESKNNETAEEKVQDGYGVKEKEEYSEVKENSGAKENTKSSTTVKKRNGNKRSGRQRGNENKMIGESINDDVAEVVQHPKQNEMKVIEEEEKAEIVPRGKKRKVPKQISTVDESEKAENGVNGSMRKRRKETDEKFEEEVEGNETDNVEREQRRKLDMGPKKVASRTTRGKKQKVVPDVSQEDDKGGKLDVEPKKAKVRKTRSRKENLVPDFTKQVQEINEEETLVVEPKKVARRKMRGRKQKMVQDDRKEEDATNEGKGTRKRVNTRTNRSIIVENELQGDSNKDSGNKEQSTRMKKSSKGGKKKTEPRTQNSGSSIEENRDSGERSTRLNSGSTCSMPTIYENGEDDGEVAGAPKPMSTAEDIAISDEKVNCSKSEISKQTSRSKQEFDGFTGSQEDVGETSLRNEAENEKEEILETARKGKRKISSTCEFDIGVDEASCGEVSLSEHVITNGCVEKVPSKLDDGSGKGAKIARKMNNTKKKRGGVQRSSEDLVVNGASLSKDRGERSVVKDKELVLPTEVVDAAEGDKQHTRKRNNKKKRGGVEKSTGDITAVSGVLSSEGSGSVMEDGEVISTEVVDAEEDDKQHKKATNGGRKAARKKDSESRIYPKRTRGKKNKIEVEKSTSVVQGEETTEDNEAEKELKELEKIDSGESLHEGKEDEEEKEAENAKCVPKNKTEGKAEKMSVKKPTKKSDERREEENPVYAGVLKNNESSLDKTSLANVRKDLSGKSGVFSKSVMVGAKENNEPATKKRRTLYNNRESSIMMNKTSAMFQETLPLNRTRTSGGVSHSLSTFMKAFIVPKLKKK